jgi:hypothetical protein
MANNWFLSYRWLDLYRTDPELLDDIAEWARLREAWQGGMRQRKMVTFVDVLSI